jgi:hypothetical protein
VTHKPALGNLAQRIGPMTLAKAMKYAKENGHLFAEQGEVAGPFGGATRWTCWNCPRAVLVVGNNAYGSAVIEECTRDRRR